MRQRIQFSTQAAAAADKANHRFVPGRGYFRYGQVPKPYVPIIGREKFCLPPDGTPDGSWHFLRPSNGGPQQKFRWHRAKKIWEPPLGHGNRLAFTAEYLAHHGWRYAARCPL